MKLQTFYKINILKIVIGGSFKPVLNFIQQIFLNKYEGILIVSHSAINGIVIKYSIIH